MPLTIVPDVGSYTYLTFQRTSNEAALRQQTLENQQAEFTLSSQQAAAATQLEQAKLATKQAQLSLDIQNSQKSLKDRELRLEVDSRKLANEQAHLILQIQQQQRTQREKELQYDVESKRLSLQLKSTSRFSTNFSLAAKRSLDNSTIVTFDPNLVVTSEVGVQMTVIIVDIYVGSITSASTNASKETLSVKQTTTARRICDPPIRWAAGCQADGAVKWVRVGTFGSYYPPGLKALNSQYASVLDSFCSRCTTYIGGLRSSEVEKNLILNLNM